MCARRPNRTPLSSFAGRRISWHVARACRARSAMDVDLLGAERLAAFRADHYRVERLAAAHVLVQQRAALLAGHVDVAPMHDGHDNRVEIEPLLGQPVLVAQGPLL